MRNPFRHFKTSSYGDFSKKWTVSPHLSRLRQRQTPPKPPETVGFSAFRGLALAFRVNFPKQINTEINRDNRGLFLIIRERYMPIRGVADIHQDC